MKTEVIFTHQISFISRYGDGVNHSQQIVLIAQMMATLVTEEIDSGEIILLKPINLPLFRDGTRGVPVEVIRDQGVRTIFVMGEGSAHTLDNPVDPRVAVSDSHAEEIRATIRGGFYELSVRLKQYGWTISGPHSHFQQSLNGGDTFEKLADKLLPKGWTND